MIYREKWVFYWFLKSSVIYLEVSYRVFTRNLKVLRVNYRYFRKYLFPMDRHISYSVSLHKTAMHSIRMSKTNLISLPVDHGSIGPCSTSLKTKHFNFLIFIIFVLKNFIKKVQVQE